MSVGIDLANQPAFGDRTALGLAVSAAERIGYSSVWVPTADRADRDAPVVVAAAATDRIRLGVALDGDHAGDATDEIAAVERLVGDRLLVAIPASGLHVVPPGGPATVLLADVPGGRLPLGAAGWSPLDPSLDDLTGGSGLVVPRVRVRVTDAPLDATRPDWHGSVEQLTQDVIRAIAAGATEVVLALHDRPPFDEALRRWALLAEAVERASG